jgi:2-polyprenyl-3-methyl-5-hydroxy-6-metoxy-1,4-benzoquinol methylase
MSDAYEYSWKSRAEMDDAQLEECSQLFSEHYGVWGETARLLDHSDRTVKQAYGRMKLGPMHAWTKAADSETNFAAQVLELPPGARVLDLGCGTGRHSLRLARLGHRVTGVDFVQNFLDEGAADAAREGLGVEFVCADGRSVDLGEQSFDTAICLYDVIGSFPDQRENQRLLDNLARHLKVGGRALVSVLNMELTRSIATRRGAVEEDPRLLQDLPPSQVMRETGNIFKPDLFLLDEGAGIVYRKEQFEGDGKPPGEYIVRDRRYTRGDVADMCRKAGLRLIWARPAALGSWGEELDACHPRAKEIVVLVERP